MHMHPFPFRRRDGSADPPAPVRARSLGRAPFSALGVAVILVGCALAGCNGGPTSPYGGGGGSNSGGGSSDAFDSGTLNAPATYVHSFAAAGNFGYHCRFHVSMGMVGTVSVAAGGADSAVVTASGTTFNPANVTIRPGGTVRWNVTSGTHTVTRD